MSESGFAATVSGMMLRIAIPASLNRGPAPRKCADMPWKAVKKNRIRPMPKDDVYTAALRTVFGLVLAERPHGERRGRLGSPSARTYKSTP